MAGLGLTPDASARQARIFYKNSLRANILRIFLCALNAERFGYIKTRPRLPRDMPQPLRHVDPDRQPQPGFIARP